MFKTLINCKAGQPERVMGSKKKKRCIALYNAMHLFRLPQGMKIHVQPNIFKNHNPSSLLSSNCSAEMPGLSRPLLLFFVPKTNQSGANNFSVMIRAPQTLLWYLVMTLSVSNTWPKVLETYYLESGQTFSLKTTLRWTSWPFKFHITALFIKVWHSSAIFYSWNQTNKRIQKKNVWDRIWLSSTNSENGKLWVTKRETNTVSFNGFHSVKLFQDDDQHQGNQMAQQTCQRESCEKVWSRL